MTKRYLGNIITQNPTAPSGPYEDDTASGVWSLAEASAYTEAGRWPTAGNTLPEVLSSATLYLDAGNSTSYAGSGGTWFDLSGNGLNAVATSPSYSSDGGGSFGFTTGDDEDFSVSNTGAVLSYGTGDFTLLMWIKPEVPSSYDLYAGQDGDGRRWYISTGQSTLSFGSSSGPNLSVSNSTSRSDTDDDGSATGSLTESQWQMIGARYSYNDSQEYITGDADIKASVTPDAGSLNFTSSTPLTIGMEGAGDFDAVGRVAVVMLWKSSLSDSEISQVYDYYAARFA